MYLEEFLRNSGIEIEIDATQVFEEMLRFVKYKPNVNFENFVDENKSYPRTILALTYNVITNMAKRWESRATLTIKYAKVILTFSDEEIYKQTLQEIVSTGIGGKFGFADDRPEIALTLPSYLALYPVDEE